MSGFQAVNTTLSVPDHPQGRSGGDTTPTTPRPNSKFFPDPKPSEDPRAEDPAAKTPTRNSFAGLTGQRPLPAEPFTPSSDIANTAKRNSILTRENLSRGNSHRSTQSVDSHDIEMGEDDDARDGSDNESVTSDTNRPSKKKKGQRFFCTDFPPCALSFTRSEHLARHIRKHTGERPFQCHCSRRFSRLDNLRQHAQTVHVNEDIPGDSLAATSTRFQRQIRTDKLRTPGPRSRAPTLGSQGNHNRGHSRNLSSSSITSTASSISVTQPPDVRRRPPTLAMANDATARARLSLSHLETYNPPLMGSPGPQIVEYNQSTGATTPTSATFSTGTGSPSRYGSGVQSPTSTASRPATWGTPRTPARRLSVPSGADPFQAATGASFPPPYIAALPPTSPAFWEAQFFGGPLTPNVPESRRESNAEADWRRRTWHPGTYTNLGPRPATSYLSYVQTPDAPHSSLTSQPAPSQTMRLPGIESFDHAPPPPSLPRRQPTPMQLDNPTRPATYHAPVEPAPQPNREKRQSISWDTTLQKDLNRLQIARDPRYTPPRPTTYPYSTSFQYEPSGHVPPSIQVPPRNPDRLSQEQPATPLRTKRQAWYNGPLPLSQQPSGQAVQRTSPEDSSSSEGVPTPSNSSMTEYHPAIRHSNGFVEDHPPAVPVEEHKPGPAPPIIERNPAHYPPYQNHTVPNSGYRREAEPVRTPYSFGNPPPSQPNAMRRLEALVAVATGEQQALGHAP